MIQHKCLNLKGCYLRVVDSHWTDHIDIMDQFRQSVGLRGYGQLNPLVEYQTAGYHMFEQMIADIEYETTRLLHEVRNSAKCNTLIVNYY